MITCTACGSANSPTDRFCASCGAFLEWSGAPVPVRQGAGQAGPSGPAEPVPISVPDRPVAEPEERLPQPEQPRPTPRRVTTDAGPIDLFCGSCGAGNATGRRFCRRCGASLDDVVVAPAEPPLSWWRRLLAWLRRTFWRKPAEPLAAGDRPRRRNDASTQRRGGGAWWRRLRMPSRISLGKAAIPIAILSLFGFGIAPVRAKVTTLVFEGYDAARRIVAPRYVPVTPAAARANTALPGHHSAAAIDQNTATYWAEGRPGTGAGAQLTVTFDGATELARIGFHNGAPGKDFPLQPRLRTVRVSVSDGTRVVSTKDLELKDTPEFQTYPLDGTARHVTVTVLRVYAGQRGTAAALTDLTFHTKK